MFPKPEQDERFLLGVERVAAALEDLARPAAMRALDAMLPMVDEMKAKERRTLFMLMRERYGEQGDQRPDGNGYRG